jgi:Cu+-exporting ATPase
MKHLVIFILALTIFSCQSGTQKTGSENQTTVQNVELTAATVNIGGMHCDNCVKSIEKGIGELNGVAEVKVSLTDSVASVKYDGTKVKIEDINKAVEARGFTIKTSL